MTVEAVEGNLAEMRMNNDLNAQSAFADASVY
jgi:hypothetical protein